METKKILMGLGVIAVMAMSVSMVVANNSSTQEDQAVIPVIEPAPLVQEAPEQVTGEVQQTIFKVSNLSCGSCLYTIEGELKKYDGMLGMGADLSQGLVSVSHSADFTDEKIAQVITEAGYPAQVLGQAELNQPSQAPGAPQQVRRGGCGSGAGGGCGSGGCGFPAGSGIPLPPTKS